MHKFKLESKYQPTGDQPTAIAELTKNFYSKRYQTLLGVTGSGKTFTMANVIQNVQKPTLIIAHNKTLAAQLYQEFRDFFPNNAVSYFVSYYDYYQPEAYIPSTDTYIEKEATINDEIDKLRLAATTNLLTRKDVIVVASVSAIYNLGSPNEYGNYVLKLVEGEVIARETIILQLANLQYDRADNEFRRGTYRIRGDQIQLWPAYTDKALLIDTLENQISRIDWIDPISGMPTTPPNNETGQNGERPTKFTIYPAKHYMLNPKDQSGAIEQIKTDLQLQLDAFKKAGKLVEAYRLEQKVNYDLQNIQEFGYTNGIENYSRYFDGRTPGDAPFTLIDYFSKNAADMGDGQFLTIVDESHITLPQIRGMYFGDQARKQNLINYGFRLPSALDNRPLKFEEFLLNTDKVTCVSATPKEYELSLCGNEPVEQLIRPTGLVDPTIQLRPISRQIEDLVVEIMNRKAIGQRTIVTTLTKKMAEALTDYLNDPEKIDTLVNSYQQRQKNELDEDTSETTIQAGSLLPIDDMEIGPVDKQFQTAAKLEVKPEDFEYPKVAYLHSDIETLERSDILDDLRRGVYDVVIGINLLREGLDLPEVSLVAILDADKEGFLRSSTSLIQTMGRAARHDNGLAILYADKITKSIKIAVDETQRRHVIQVAYNKKHGITPQTIVKPIRDRMLEKQEDDQPYFDETKPTMVVKLNKSEQIDLNAIDPEELTPDEKKKIAAKLKRRMSQAAKDMDFELAAILRDLVKKLIE